MKKSNKKNIWVPGKPMTPKAREMLESGKGAMNADGRWTCLECNRSLSNEWTLEQHIQTVHGARTFSCDVSTINSIKSAYALFFHLILCFHILT